VCVNERLTVGQKSCGSSGSRELIELFRQHFSKQGLDIPVEEQVCLGRCAQGIAIRIAPGGPFFTEVTEQDIADISLAAKQFTPAAVEPP